MTQVTTSMNLPSWLTPKLIAGMLRGIEKEGLRMRADGYIADTPHPRKLGSKLTHPYITTDYAESLLELITEPKSTVKDALEMLRDLHIVVHQALEKDELLWSLSMPCMISEDEAILLADYGRSNVGQFKTLYRHGLGIRYGRRMQTIAGLHYNLSFSEALFATWQQQLNNTESLTDFKNDKYLGLIRNFKRLSSMVLYLVGASPAVCACFLKGRAHPLQPLNATTYYLPNATSLRMGKLGYQNSVQDDLDIRYNSLDEYVTGLRNAIHTPHPNFTALGLADAAGNPIQINDHILQIENEYYSPIRPKQITEAGENPSDALAKRGIAYVELRAIDLDPYNEIGISMDTACFMEILALYCLLCDSPELLPDEEARLAQNQERVVNEGRDATVMIDTPMGELSFHQWLHEHLLSMRKIAELMDITYGSNDYRTAWQAMMARAQNPDNTPSAQVLADTKRFGSSWQFGKSLAQMHATHLKHQGMLPTKLAHFDSLAQDSLRTQAQIEQDDQQSFADYMRQYRS